jgi:hypothetical protein
MSALGSNQHPSRTLAGSVMKKVDIEEEHDSAAGDSDFEWDISVVLIFSFLVI